MTLVDLALKTRDGTKPRENAPTISTVLGGFLASLLLWGRELVDAAWEIPATVLNSGTALIAFLLLILVGWISQRFTFPREWFKHPDPEVPEDAIDESDTIELED